MKNHTSLVLILPVLAACAAPRGAAPREFAASVDPPMGLIEGPAVAPAARDISEAERRAWFDAQRPAAEPEYRPAQVERVVVVRESEPESYRCYDRGYGRYDGWYLPFSLSLGYWGGRHHRGWGWGLGWRSGCW